MEVGPLLELLLSRRRWSAGPLAIFAGGRALPPLRSQRSGLAPQYLHSILFNARGADVVSCLPVGHREKKRTHPLTDR